MISSAIIGGAAGAITLTGLNKLVKAVNGNIKSLLRRAPGYKKLRYLLLKCRRMAVTKIEFVAFRKAA